MGKWSLGFFSLFFLMEKLCLVCVYQWAFSFSLFDFNVSKCLTNVALFLFFSFSFCLFSLVNSVWPKLQDVWWISYAKAHHHHWTRYINGHFARKLFPSHSLLSPPPPFLSRTRPHPAQRHLQSPVTWRIPILLLLPMKCFVPEVLITCLQKEKKNSKHIATDCYAPYRNRRFLIMSG